MKPIPRSAFAFLEELQVSFELIAAGVAMSPRIRVVGSDDCRIITLPTDQWSMGRTLAAATPFAMINMARAIIVSTAGIGDFESWLLSRDGVTGLRSYFSWSPTFTVEHTIQFDGLAEAPPLAQRFSWVCQRRTHELDAASVVLSAEVFGENGICDVQRIGALGHEAGAA